MFRPKPMPGNLLAEVTPVDLPQKLSDQLAHHGSHISDEYLVCDPHNTVYITLHPRQHTQETSEIKLFHHGFKVFIPKIKIHDAKHGEMKCVATASIHGVNVWKQAELTPGEHKTPVKEFKFEDQTRAPHFELPVSPFEIQKFALCHDQKTLILLMKYHYINYSGYVVRNQTFFSCLRFINLETGKKVDNWPKEGCCDFRLLPGKKENETRVVLFTIHGSSEEMMVDLSHYQLKNMSETCMDRPVEYRESSLDATYFCSQPKRTIPHPTAAPLSIWTRCNSEQPPLQLSLSDGFQFYHMHFFGNRLGYGYYPTIPNRFQLRYGLIEPETCGVYSLSDFYSGFREFYDLNPSHSAQLNPYFFCEDTRTKTVVKIEFHPTSSCADEKAHQAEIARCIPQLPVPVIGMVSQYVGSFHYYQPEFIHPGIFSTALLHRIFSTLFKLQFAYKNQEKEKNSKIILQNLLKKLTRLKQNGHRFTEQDIEKIFPDPKVKIPEKDNPVIPAVEEIINDMYTEMMEHVNNQANEVVSLQGV